jgi:hypothetical protein
VKSKRLLWDEHLAWIGLKHRILTEKYLGKWSHGRQDIDEKHYCESDWYSM